MRLPATGSGRTLLEDVDEELSTADADEPVMSVIFYPLGQEQAKSGFASFEVDFSEYGPALTLQAKMNEQDWSPPVKTHWWGYDAHPFYNFARAGLTDDTRLTFRVKRTREDGAVSAIQTLN